MKKQNNIPSLYRVPGQPHREDNLVSKYRIYGVSSEFGIENGQSFVDGRKTKLEQNENQA